MEPDFANPSANWKYQVSSVLADVNEGLHLWVEHVWVCKGESVVDLAFTILRAHCLVYSRRYLEEAALVVSLFLNIRNHIVLVLKQVRGDFGRIN